MAVLLLDLLLDLVRLRAEFEYFLSVLGVFFRPFLTWTILYTVHCVPPWSWQWNPPIAESGSLAATAFDIIRLNFFLVGTNVYITGGNLLSSSNSLIFFFSRKAVAFCYWRYCWFCLWPNGIFAALPPLSSVESMFFAKAWVVLIHPWWKVSVNWSMTRLFWFHSHLGHSVRSRTIYWYCLLILSE